MSIANIYDQLKRDEGSRLFPYVDTVGKVTIGVGRNLTDSGISQSECDAMLDNDVSVAIAGLKQHLPWTASLDEVRFGVLTNMAFNMGVGGLLGFKNMLAALQSGDYAGAAEQMLDSKWAEQVGARAQRLAVQIEQGVWT